MRVRSIIISVILFTFLFSFTSLAFYDFPSNTDMGVVYFSGTTTSASQLLTDSSSYSGSWPQLTKDMIQGHTYHIQFGIPYFANITTNGTGVYSVAKSVTDTFLYYDELQYVISNSQVTDIYFIYTGNDSFHYSGKALYSWTSTKVGYNYAHWDIMWPVNLIEDTTPAGNKTDNEALNSIDRGIQEGNQQAADRFQEEKDTASQQGQDASDFASETESKIRSGWDILWFPITFTQDLLAVFTGGSSTVAYKVDGYKITGYTYDSASGNLVPVMERASPIMPIASAGTSITFPSYTLPGLNIKLWDDYSYDISSLRTDFSAVFTASDTLITMLELYWCIGFLRGKYHDVFD